MAGRNESLRVRKRREEKKNDEISKDMKKEYLKNTFAATSGLIIFSLNK